MGFDVFLPEAKPGFYGIGVKFLEYIWFVFLYFIMGIKNRNHIKMLN